MILILAMSVAVQSSTPAAAQPRHDLELARGVEEFVMAGAPARAVPEPYLGLIARLADPSWRRRDGATRELAAAAAADPRWLFWGRRDPDPEVRLRCNAILRRLNPCPGCGETGQSKNWDAWPCWDCDGTGTGWPYSMWD